VKDGAEAKKRRKKKGDDGFCGRTVWGCEAEDIDKSDGKKCAQRQEGRQKTPEGPGADRNFASYQMPGSKCGNYSAREECKHKKTMARGAPDGRDGRCEEK